jgi:hypothetical protein
MKDLKLVLVSNITSCDILDNISKECEAILINEDMFWIEVLEDGFGVNDGWNLNKTKDIKKAVEMLENFIQENL